MINGWMHVHRLTDNAWIDKHMDVQTDRRMDILTDRCMHLDRQIINGWMNGWMDGWCMDRQAHGWMDGRTNRMENIWMDVDTQQIDGWMDIWIDE